MHTRAKVLFVDAMKLQAMTLVKCSFPNFDAAFRSLACEGLAVMGEDILAQALAKF
jgi:hypothetical protein